MIVYVHPADLYGCGHVRMIWPAAALIAQGHDVRIMLPSHQRGIGGEIDTSTDTLINVTAPDDADVIVLQRVATKHMASAVQLLRAKGIAVVVDMDDDLTKIDPNNLAFGTLSGTTGRQSWKHAHRACLDATLVTVSTPALLRTYAPHGRGVVIQNCFPAGYLGIEHDLESRVFGWPGAIGTHPHDPQAMGHAVARLIREGYEYLGVGATYARTPGDGALARALGVPGEIASVGDVDINTWPRAIARLGVGLAPLADTAFNAAKSWLKPLDLMACGVPWVASPRVEYVRLHKATGVGLLARQPNDWYRQIKKLLDDDGLRAEMSARGREAAKDWTIEGNAWRWLDAWKHAMALQREDRAGRPAVV